jgi:predicted dehydrogenase
VGPKVIDVRAEIRVALIGFGDAGRQFHAPLISSTPGLTLAVFGSSQGISAGSSYPGVVVVPDWLAAARHPDVDLVVIATPNDTHAPLAEAALLAGKHVVVDKPFTVTLAEARALAATASAAERELSVFQNRRWDSDFLGIARELAVGRIGEVVEFRSEISRFRPQIRDRWRERAGPGAGIWYDLAPHLVDQALVLFGSPETVQADLQIQRSGGSTVDWFHSVLGYGRTRVILTSSSIAADGGMRFLVRGTNGSLSKRRGDLLDDHVADPLILVTGEGEAPIEIAAPAGDHRGYYIALRDALHGEGKVPVTPAQATTLMAIIEAGAQSSDEGRVVRPDYTEAERVAWEPVVDRRTSSLNLH